MGKETLPFLSEAELQALGDVSNAARRATRPTPGVLLMAWLLAAAVIVPSLPALMLGAARLLELQALAGALGRWTRYGVRLTYLMAAANSSFEAFW